MSSTVFYWIYTSAAIGTAAYIITRSGITEPFRMWMRKRALAYPKYWDWVYELFDCPLCTSVWLAFGWTSIMGPTWAYSTPIYRWPLEFLANSLSLIPIAMATVYIIRKALK